MTTNDPSAKPRGRGSRRRIILLFAAIILAAAAASRLNRSASSEPGDDLSFTVAEGPLTISVTESGTVKPREQEIIKSEIEGRTTILYLVPEGTRVKEGELLVELDASSLADSKIDQEIQVENTEAGFIQTREDLEVVKNQAQSDIEKAELTLRFAKEDLQQYIDGEYPNALSEHEARITLAEEEARRAEEDYKWSKILFDEQYLAESELKADELAVKKARLDVELAKNNLTLLKEFTYKRTLAELESDVRQAEMALERVKRKASADVLQAEAKLRAKESELRQQRDKLKKINDQIAKARIVAPREGLVVYATSAKFHWRGNEEPLSEGQEVREREELIHLPTASTFMAEVKVHESNLEKIQVGLPVRITVDALPGREFKGKVAVIAPLPDPMSMFMNPDLKVYDMEIHIDGGGEVLRTGMSCSAEIFIDRYDSVLYVPVQAVVRVSGEPTVFVMEKSGVVPRTVKIGLDNNRMVHVLDGLAAGDKVILTPPLDTAEAPAEEKAKPSASERESTGEAAKNPVPDSSEPDTQAASVQTETPPNPKALNDDTREKMRERFKNMSPEEREALRKQFGGRGGQRAGAASPSEEN